MNTKSWVIFGAVCVLLFGGLIYFSKQNKVSVDLNGVDINKVITASDQNGNIADHTLGNPDGKVVLIEYGDIQCPSCGGAHPGIKKIAEDYGDKIGFIFRNFPLTSAHPNALAAATAAEAAGLQGKYWEMHNTLFEDQNTWSGLSADQRTAKFVEYAKLSGVTDETKFKADLTNSAIASKIGFDQAVARQKSVSATPTFFLNGEQVDSEISGKLVKGDATAMRALIDRKLKENNIEPPVSAAAKTEETAN
ncbi:hypothetical protein EON76_01020 [bacterium]|nr:MAG: hypothetical protein EON76_01020 [bacterium]